MTTTYGTLRHFRPDGGNRGAWGITAEPHVMIRLKRTLPRIRATRTGEVTVVDTPEMARELSWFMDRFPLAMDDITAQRLAKRLALFEEKQAAVAHVLAGNGGLPGLMEPAREPRPYQATAVAMMQASGRMILGDDLGLGKAQPLDAPVLTPTGFRPMGELREGDLVVSADGTPTEITGVFPQGELDCYRVTFSDGATVECNDEHLWQTRYYRRTRSRVDGSWCPVNWQARTLRELIGKGLRTSSGQAKWHVPMVEAPDLDPDGTGYRPLDGYLIGVLLGDGGLTGKGIRLTSDDPELVAEVQRVAPPGTTVSRVPGTTQDYYVSWAGAPEKCALCDEWAVARGLCMGCYNHAKHLERRDGTPLPPKRESRSPLIEALRRLGMWGKGSLDKVIPLSYRLAPVADRLALLQGLMDTDGYAMPISSGTATAQFFSSSRYLAEGVRWIAESLGGTGRMSSKFFEGRDRYTVTVKLPQPYNPFRLSRKASVWGQGHETLRPTRAIVDVEHVGRKAMQCIRVAHPSHLYVTDRFVVTHNTMSGLCLLAAEGALPALVVTQTHLPPQWLRELGATWPMLLGHTLRGTKPYDLADIRGHRGYVPDVLVAPYSRVAGWADELAGKIRTVIVDECQELRNGTATAKGTALAQIADQANYVVGLSATPVYNYGEEIHAIYSIIAPDALGDEREFKQEWCSGTGPSGHALVKDPAALGTYLRDQGLFLRRTRTEVRRELPEVLRVRQEVESDPAAIEQLSTNTLALARLILDKQTDRNRRFVAMGNLDAQLRQATGIAKAPYVAAFVRLILESEPKVLLFGWHHAVYDVWREQLADMKPVFYTGEESPAQKRAAYERFVDGDSRVMVMSLRSGAGLDGLQTAASVCVFGEMDWSPGVHDQAIGRLNRDGQTRPVVAYFPVSDSGSDPVMDQVLQLKRAQAEPIRNPDAPLFEPTADAAADHVRLLAEAVVARAAHRAA